MSFRKSARAVLCAGVALAGLWSAPAGAQRGGNPFGQQRRTAGALRAELFALPPQTDRLPDFSRLRPFGTLFATTIDIPHRHFSEGFPGVPGRVEWFGVRYAGKFRATRGGEHAFRVFSDDGARLFVDGRLVVDNDGIHGPTSASGSVTLTPGEHDLVLEYFQGPRFDIALQLFWTPPGESEALLHV